MGDGVDPARLVNVLLWSVDLSQIGARLKAPSILAQNVMGFCGIPWSRPLCGYD